MHYSSTSTNSLLFPLLTTKNDGLGINKLIVPGPCETHLRHFLLSLLCLYILLWRPSNSSEVYKCKKILQHSFEIPPPPFGLNICYRHDHKIQQHTSVSQAKQRLQRQNIWVLISAKITDPFCRLWISTLRQAKSTSFSRLRFSYRIRKRLSITWCLYLSPILYRPAQERTMKLLQ